jgi:hypothetical protein
MAPGPGDLMDLTAGDASKQHAAAITRNYISQPRLSMILAICPVTIAIDCIKANNFEL